MYSYKHVNAQSHTRWSYSNEQLDRYFKDVVAPGKAETRRVISALKPDLDALFNYIKDKDERLCGKVVNIGSYYQGLKVRHSDEFDYSVCLNISSIPNLIFSEDLTAWYGFTEPKENPGYDWHEAHTVPQEMPSGNLSFLHRSLHKDLNIERKTRPLVSPGKGYHIVRFPPPRLSPLPPPLPHWKSEFVDFLHPAWADLFFRDDLVPYLVKMKFKDVLLGAVRSSRRYHGMTVLQCVWIVHNDKLKSLLAARRYASAVFAIATCPDVRLSVCLSVTRRYCA